MRGNGFRRGAKPLSDFLHYLSFKGKRGNYYVRGASLSLVLNSNQGV